MSLHRYMFNVYVVKGCGHVIWDFVIPIVAKFSIYIKATTFKEPLLSTNGRYLL